MSPTEKTFSRKNTGKKTNVFDGFELAGKQRFQYDSNALPTKGSTGKNTAVSTNLYLCRLLCVDALC
jgi:hypothetical protein